MFTHEEQSIKVSDAHTAEKSDFSPNLIEERLKANLEHLHAQISKMTQMMKKLIHENLARLNLTAGFRVCRFQSESPLVDGPRTSRSLPLASLVTAGYTPDIELVGNGSF